MMAPENAKIGVCYIWVISLLLFIFTLSGAVFLVLYMIQPSSTTAYWYPIIGVSLVCFPWFFWSLTILYRIVSRACGFRMICFGRFGSDHSDDIVPSDGAVTTSGRGGAPIHDVNDDDFGGGGGNLVDIESGDMNVNRTSGVGGAQPGSPKRVHFGGVVVIGEDEDGAHGNQESSNPLPSPSSSSSSSSSSSPSRERNESEMPLRLFMAS